MHCMVFRNSIEPSFCVTFEVDITEFRRRVKDMGSFLYYGDGIRCL